MSNLKCVHFCQHMQRFIRKCDFDMERCYHFMKRCLFSGESVRIVSFHFLGFLFGRDQKMNLKRSPHSSVPDGGARGTRLALRRRRDIEKTVEKKPLKHL